MFSSQAERVRSEVRQRAANMRAAGISAGFLGGAVSHQQRLGQGQDQMANAQEQYAHNRGTEYATVRPIAQRAASQRILMARVKRKPTRFTSRRTPHTYGCKTPLWVKTLVGGDEERLEIIDQHPALDAIHRPNELHVDWTLKYSTVASLELTGWAYWWFPRVKGVKQIWHLPTHWVTPKHDGGIFTGWSVRPEGATEAKPLPASEIAPYWYPDPGNPIGALSPLQANAHSVLVDEYIIMAQRNAFERGIHPRLAVMVGDIPSKLGGIGRRPRLRGHQRRQIRNALSSRLQGVGKYGDFVLLDRLISDIKPISNKVNEMDFPDSMKSSEGRVARGHGVNPTIMGANEGVNYAQAAVAERLFCDQTINPKLEMLGRVMTIWVIPQFDTADDLVLFFEPSESQDPQQKLREWAKAADLGYITLNQFNMNVLGLPFDPKGEIYLRPTKSTVVPVADADKPTQAVQLAVGGQDDDDDEDEEEKPDSTDDGKRSLSYASHLTHWLRRHEAGEKSLADDFHKLLVAQGNAVIEGLVALNYADADTASRLLNPADWTEQLRKVAEPRLLAMMIEGAMLELAAFGRDEKQYGQRLQKLADITVPIPHEVLAGIQDSLETSLAQPHWDGLSVTARDSLTSELQAGLGGGETIEQLIKRVRDNVFGGTITRRRAEVIARTETTGAMNAGQHEARRYLEDEGIIEGKEWFATIDNRTRDTHYATDGQRRRNSEYFEFPDGELALYPGHPAISAANRVNCRCIAAAVTLFSKHIVRPLQIAFTCPIHQKA